MRYFAGLIACGLIMVASAKAEDIPDSTIVHTILCEAGRVGQELAKKNLPLNARVVVDWKEVDGSTTTGGGGAKIPVVELGGSVDISKTKEDTLKSAGIPFNLHPANYAACTGYKVEIIKDGIGLYDCLVGKKFTSLEEALKQEEGTASCGSLVTVIKKGGLSLRVKVLGADLGPEGSYESKLVLDTAFAAPSYKKGSFRDR
jgi:hypothetical protein